MSIDCVPPPPSRSGIHSTGPEADAVAPLPNAGVGSVARVGRPSAALYVFWGVAFLTMIFGHYQVSYRLNLPYKALTVLVCLIMPFTPGFFAMLTKRQVYYLLAFELVLIAGCLTGYTGSPGDLFTVSSQPVVMLRVFPFMLCGYTLAVYPRSEKWFISLLVALFAAITLPDAIVLLRGTASGQFRERFLTEVYDQTSSRALISAMVNVSVAGLLLTLAGFRLYDNSRGVFRLLLGIPQAILASLSVTAGFTAAVILLAWCGVATVLFAPARTLRFRLLLLVGIGIALPAGYLALRTRAGEKGGSLAKIYRRIDGLRQMISGREVDNATEVTSGRMALAGRSLSSFASSPLVGLGRGVGQSEKGGDTDTIGGHSFLLDSLGQRGLLGTLPLIMWLWSLANLAWHCLARERSWRASCDLSFVLTWVAAITINPYFLGYLALNSIVFLWFGFILGDGARVAMADARAIETRRRTPTAVPLTA